jgi:hypothetical protein
VRGSEKGRVETDVPHCGKAALAGILFPLSSRVFFFPYGREPLSSSSGPSPRAPRCQPRVLDSEQRRLLAQDQDTFRGLSPRGDKEAPPRDRTLACSRARANRSHATCGCTLLLAEGPDHLPLSAMGTSDFGASPLP